MNPPCGRSIWERCEFVIIKNKQTNNVAYYCSIAAGSIGSIGSVFGIGSAVVAAAASSLLTFYR